MILMGVFGLHELLLMTLRRPHALIIAQAAATALAWTAAALLIPRFGIAGYAFAEIAAAAAWLVPAVPVHRHFGDVRYVPALLWAAAAEPRRARAAHRLVAGPRPPGPRPAPPDPPAPRRHRGQARARLPHRS